VNSRSELAMSRVFNVPERELTHQAFTDLKHGAQQKKMTMYQVEAMSDCLSLIPSRIICRIVNLLYPSEKKGFYGGIYESACPPVL